MKILPKITIADYIAFKQDVNRSDECTACGDGQYNIVPAHQLVMAHGDKSVTIGIDDFSFVHWFETLGQRLVQMPAEEGVRLKYRQATLEELTDSKSIDYQGFLIFVCSNCGDSRFIKAEAVLKRLDKINQKIENE